MKYNRSLDLMLSASIALKAGKHIEASTALKAAVSHPSFEAAQRIIEASNDAAFKADTVLSKRAKRLAASEEDEVEVDVEEDEDEAEAEEDQAEDEDVEVEEEDDLEDESAEVFAKLLAGMKGTDAKKTVSATKATKKTVRRSR